MLPLGTPGNSSVFHTGMVHGYKIGIESHEHPTFGCSKSKLVNIRQTTPIGVLGR